MTGDEFNAYKEFATKNYFHYRLGGCSLAAEHKVVGSNPVSNHTHDTPRGSSLDKLLLILKTLFPLKTCYLNEEVNCSEPSQSVSVPWL